MRLQFLTAMLLLGGSVVAQEKVPDPEIERQAFKVADGFEVTLFAADPAIAKPIGMNFDSAGRLWVTSSTLYPQIKPGEVANDKIIMLEDKDGDGRAEAGKIFAEGLYIPTGVEFGDGGVYVGASTELLHFKDTDGDGKADVRKVVLSGFGTEDTHHTVHTLRWGPDGQLYFNQSIYIHSHIETPWGPRRLSGSGTWRLRPRSMELEVLTRGLVNPWGHTWDRFGQEFATDGAGSDGVSIYIPGAAYGSWGTDAKRWIGGVNPGSPKYCGAEIVSGRHLPEDWQGSLITNDFRANRVVRFVLREEGAGYTAKLMSDVIKSSDKAFRPVDVKMGPDGAIYIADWYNPVINHGEVDFRSPMRDHTHGRIWRLTAKSRPLLQRPKIAGAPISELLEMLKAPEQWTRHMARRELYERDAKEVAAALGTWVKNIGGSDPQSEHQRLEALWTYETIDVVEPNLLASLLKADDPHIRAAATHALHFWGKRVPNGIDLLGAAVADENPQVRLNAVISLGQIPSLRSIELAMSALDRPMDRWIDYGLYLTINKLKDTWLPAVSSGQFTFNDNPRHLAVALQALESSEAVAPLLVLLKRGTIQPERAAGMIGVIASSGGPQELAELWDYLLRSKDSKVLVAGMGALLGSARDRNVLPAVKTADVVKLISNQDESVALGAIRLAGAWRVREAGDELTKIALKQNASSALRQASIEALGQIGTSTRVLSDLAANEKSETVRVAAIRAMAGGDLKAAAARAAEILSSKDAPADPDALIGAFLQRQDGGKTLAAALGGVKLPPDSAKLALRFIYSTGRPEPELEKLLRASADINTQLQNLSPQQLKQLAADVQKNGDAGRGEVIFRSKTANCFTCHAIGGAGGNVGPDMSAVGTASPMEYLIESILEPNKNVKEGFEAIAVTTKTNDFYAGIRVRQTEKELVLRDALSSQITIPLNTIKKQQNAGSLMPSGLADLLTKQEFLDLMKFISVLGTPGHDVTQSGPVVRRWRALDTPLKDGATPVELDDTYSFSPIYSTVAGELPMSELPRHKKNVVTFVVEVSTPGAAIMTVNSTAGLKAYINTSDLDLSRPTLELSRGGHMFSIEINRNMRSEPLKITLQEAPDSKARFRIVGGR